MQDLRTVIVEETPAYRTDNGAGQYKFTVNRYFDGKDLSLLTPFLKIRFQDKTSDKLLLNEPEVDLDKLIFTFTVQEAFSRVAGKAECQLCFENTDASVVINTRIFTVQIFDSIEVESYGQTILPSAIRLLQTALSEKIDKMNQAIDSANKAVTIVKAAVLAENFSNGSQTLAAQGVNSSSVVLFTPETNPQAVFNAGIYISNKSQNAVTLTAVNPISDDFTASFVIINPIETLSD